MLNFRKTTLFAFLTAGLMFIMSSGDILAQGRGRGGPGGQGFGRRGAGGGGLQGLLRRDDVRKELEITEEQIEDLQTLQQDRGGFDREAMREMREEMADLSPEERREKFMEMRNEREAEVKEELKEILLPFQLKRLEQISAQQAANRPGSTSLIAGPLADKLKISDKQKDKIRERAEKLQKEFNERVEKMRKDMQEEILSELTPAQRKEYKELMGETFQFDEQERGDRGGRRGRRGRQADDSDV